VSLNRRGAGTRPEGLVRKREGGRGEGDFFPGTRKEQGSEGESPRALGAERGFQGLGGLVRRREGSQTLRAGLPGGKATHPGRLGRGEKKGSSDLDMLKGWDAPARGLGRRFCESTGTELSGR
jgi:hypothetical protein